MFGSDLLVAPMFASGEQRKVYLPPGKWIDYQSGVVYEGEKWHDIKLGEIPVVLLVKNHTVLPHIKVAQSTKDMDWNNVELRVFSTGGEPVSGLFTRPDSGVQTLSLIPRGNSFALRNDPQAGKVKWTINSQSLAR
jgi:alpha-D-xyloside xylohydrolase